MIPADLYIVAALSIGAALAIWLGCVAWRYRERIVREWRFRRLRIALNSGGIGIAMIGKRGPGRAR